LWLLLRGVGIETLDLLGNAHLQRPKSVVGFRPLFLDVACPFLEIFDGTSEFTRVFRLEKAFENTS